MKAIIKSTAIGVALLLAPISSLLFFSCEKEPIDIVQTPPVEPPAPPVTSNTCNRPNEVEDLIAWFDPIEDVLLVNPAYLEQSLALLDAQPTSDGRFSATAVTANFEPVIITFSIKEAASNIIAAQAASLPLEPDLVATYTADGSSFKQYKNAKCGEVEKGFLGPCNNTNDGGSTKNEWYDRRRCGRGDGFCTEVLAPMGRRITYINANCQGPTKSESPYFGYQCWQ